MSATKASSKRKIRLKTLKELKTIWHPESTLVYKSKKERVVIGRYVDGELISLDEEALDLCEEWNMKPDESLLETQSSPDEGNGEDEGEAQNDEGEDEGEAQNDEGENEGEDEGEANQGDSNDDCTKENAVSDPGQQDDINKIINEYNIYSKSFLSKLINASEMKDSNSSAKLSAKQEECDKLRTELDVLQAKYDEIEKKFAAVKTLFA